MPGSHLSDTEKKLKSLWNSNSEIPFLKGISIGNGTPIRGLKNCKVEFKYPITVFCGKNGSGKTTFLQLAALAFHNEDKKYRKVFSDFFKKTRYDPSNEGIDLTWFYKGKIKRNPNGNISVHKGSKKWMHYDRRPIKKVIILPVSRTLPSNEKRYAMADALSESDFKDLDGTFLGYFKEIMGRSYEKMSEYQGLFSKCKRNETCGYSCYNMGIGERILCYILSKLQEAENESVFIIDEIEMGLHPEALSSLANVIQKVAFDKKLQFFITTHSRDFLDALPREARLLINRVDDSIEAINCPTSIYAMSQMSKIQTAELVVFCEDNVAENIIKHSSKGIQNRIICTGVGSKTEIVKAVKLHKLSHDPRRCMIIWDGDVLDSDIYKYIKGETIDYAKLPGNMAPEKWIINSLDNEDGIKILSDFLTQNETFVENLLNIAKSTTDCHDIFYKLSEKMMCSEKEAISLFCRALLKVNPAGLSDLKNNIENVLNGNIHCT